MSSASDDDLNPEQLGRSVVGADRSPPLGDAVAARVAALLRARVRVGLREWMRDFARGGRHRRRAEQQIQVGDFGGLVDIGEIAVLVEARVGPAVLADTVNDSLALLLEIFPAELVLASPVAPTTTAPLPGAPPRPRDWAATAALTSQARTRALVDHAAGLLHAHPHAGLVLWPGCPACSVRAVTPDHPGGRPDSSVKVDANGPYGAGAYSFCPDDVGGSESDGAVEKALLDVRDVGGVLTELDVAVELGGRGIGGEMDSVEFQHRVLALLLVWHGARVAKLYQQMGWTPDYAADPSRRGW